MTLSIISLINKEILGSIIKNFIKIGNIDG